MSNIIPIAWVIKNYSEKRKRWSVLMSAGSFRITFFLIEKEGEEMLKQLSMEHTDMKFKLSPVYVLESIEEETDEW